MKNVASAQSPQRAESGPCGPELFYDCLHVVLGFALSGRYSECSQQHTWYSPGTRYQLPATRYLLLECSTWYLAWTLLQQRYFAIEEDGFDSAIKTR